MTCERLDEAIDRVANAMTAVPDDPGFTARLGKRLESSYPAATYGVLVVSALVLILAVGVVRHGSTIRERRSGAAPAAESIAADAAVVFPVERDARDIVVLVAPPSILVAPATSEQLPALQVSELSLEPLNIAPADIAPLEVASLELTEIDGTGESKEPK